MRKSISERNLTWIDIEKPTQADVNWLGATFNFHPVTLSELIPPSQREKVENFENYLFLVLYVPVFNEKKQTTKPTELDILVTKNSVITVHIEPIEPLGSFLKKCRTTPPLKESCFGRTTGHLLYWLINDILKFAQRQLIHIAKNISKIEDRIFENIERGMIKEISFVKRDILDFRIAVRPMHRILESLDKKGVHFWSEPQDLDFYFSDLLGDYDRVWSEVDNFADTINSLEATNTNLLNDKTNAIIKTFTILSFITFPAMLVATILQVNTATNPIRDLPHDFWILLGFVVLTVFGMWIYFKTRKWL